MLKHRVRSWIKQEIEQRLDCVVLRELPHGFSALHDIRRREGDIRTVVDVGANVGQSARRFAAVWPTARILCLEPVSAAFQLLVANTQDIENITPVQCALGASPGQHRIVLQPGTPNNSLLNVATPDAPQTATEVIDVTTLDMFARDRGLRHIDLLKVDTEGYDLEVLNGATRLLAERAISVVQVEAGMNPYNEKHVPLAEIQRRLESAGYVLFGLYDQTPEWTGEARLRFVDAVFVADPDARWNAPTVSINAIRGGLSPARRRR